MKVSGKVSPLWGYFAILMVALYMVSGKVSPQMPLFNIHYKGESGFLLQR